MENQNKRTPVRQYLLLAAAAVLLISGVIMVARKYYNVEGALFARPETLKRVQNSHTEDNPGQDPEQERIRVDYAPTHVHIPDDFSEYVYPDVLSGTYIYDEQKKDPHPPVKGVLKPRDVWENIKKFSVPLSLSIESAETIPCDYAPDVSLKHLVLQFHSQELGGTKWVHKAEVLIPEHSSAKWKSNKKAKVVIIGTPVWDGYMPIHVRKFGHRIAGKAGYPVMICALPGYDEEGNDLEIGLFRRVRNFARSKGDSTINMYGQCGMVYIRALDAFEEILKVPSVEAVIGGHSKRAGGAPFAAAIDNRISSVVIMGWEMEHKNAPWYYSYYQDQVHVPVLYLGGTNETGYKMFTITDMQEHLERPMTIEMIANYSHSNFSDIQYMDFLMWVSHVYDKRPITKIDSISWNWTKNASFTQFKAKVETKAKIQIVRVWYAYTDDPAWRDVMWFHRIMEPTGNGFYEENLPGVAPDAFFIEVGDIANGIPGYVSSVPINVTNRRVAEKNPRGDFPRGWRRIYEQ